MVDVITKIEIDKPIDAVSEYAANPDHTPEWYVNIKSAEWKSPKPLAVGSQIAFRAEFLRKDLIYTYEIKEYIPQEILVMETAEGPFPMKTTYTWEKINEKQTRMTLRITGQPTGFSKIFAATMMKKANLKDLKKIKAILEKQ